MARGKYEHLNDLLVNVNSDRREYHPHEYYEPEYSLNKIFRKPKKMSLNEQFSYLVDPD